MQSCRIEDGKCANRGFRFFLSVRHGRMSAQSLPAIRREWVRLDEMHSGIRAGPSPAFNQGA
jgi:hypothetical protein